MCFFLLCLLISLIRTNSIHIVSIPYNPKYQRPYPNITFVNEQFSVHSFFNTFLPYSVFVKSNNPIIWKDKDIDFEIYNFHSVTNVQRITLSNYSAYFSKSLMDYKDLGISLYHHYEDDSVSFIHQLYREGYIDKLQFIIEDQHNENGNIHFGGIPDTINIKTKNKSILPINTNLPTWGFQLTKLIIGGKSYDINLPCIIHTGLYRMIYSDEFFNIFENELFKKDINNKRCEIINKESIGKSIECIEEVEIENEIIEFDFNNVKIKLKIKDLFTPYNSSFFNSNPYKNYNFTGLIFGYKFLSLFDLTVFNYRNHDITFYSDKIQMYSYPNIYIIIYITITIICSINSISYFVLFKYK